MATPSIFRIRGWAGGLGSMPATNKAAWLRSGFSGLGEPLARQVVVSVKFAEEQPQILRLRKPQKARLSALRMTAQLMTAQLMTAQSMTAQLLSEFQAQDS